jgi:rubrerythrin
MDVKNHSALLKAQRNEITEYAIYSRLAQKTKDPHNEKVLRTIAEDEMQHYQVWESITGKEVKPSLWWVRWQPYHWPLPL